MIAQRIKKAIARRAKALASNFRDAMRPRMSRAEFDGKTPQERSEFVLRRRGVVIDD